MRVGICDDEAIMRRKIRQICNRSLVELDLNCEVIEFRNGTEIIDFAEALDILILDIEMPGMNGIEVKKRFQAMKHNVIIIYVTSHDEMMQEAFGLNVLGFVEKEYMEQMLPVMLASALETVGRFVVLEDGIDSREIAYIRTEQIYCRLFLVDGGERLLRVSMKELESQLGDVGFFRIHRVYLVNFQYVEDIDASTVFVMKQRIPISVRKRAKVKEAYEKFCERQAGCFR